MANQTLCDICAVPIKRHGSYSASTSEGTHFGLYENNTCKEGMRVVLCPKCVKKAMFGLNFRSYVGKLQEQAGQKPFWNERPF